VKEDWNLLDDKHLLQIEGDTYWCVNKIVGNMLDLYSAGFPRGQLMMKQLQTLVRLVNGRSGSFAVFLSECLFLRTIG
jgi:hypothetical protein